MNDKPTYRIRFQDVDDAEGVASQILDAYGDDYDAKLGDFTVEVLDANAIQVILRDVALGDVKAVAEGVIDDIVGGAAFQVSKREAGSWFAVDLEDDD